MLLRREQLQAPFRTDGDVTEDEPTDGEEAEGKAKKAKGKAKAKAKAKGKAKAKAKAKGKAKAKAKAKGKAKAKAKAKGKAKGKASAKPKARKSKEGKGKNAANEDCEAKRQKSTEEGKESGKGPTFARRYKPVPEDAATRFEAIKDVFMSDIAGLVNRQSLLQDCSQRYVLFFKSPTVFQAAKEICFEGFN